MAKSLEHSATQSRLNFMSNIKLGAKIYGGFGAVLALIVGLSIFVIFETGVIESDFGEYGEVSSDAVILNDLDAEIMTMAWQAGEYSFTWDKDTLGQAKELMAGVDTMLTDMIKDAAENPSSDPRAQKNKEALDKIVALYKSYVTQFDVMSGEFGAITKLIDEGTDPAGAAVADALGKIIAGAMSAGNYQAAAIAGQAQESFLRAQVFANNFLDTSEEGAVEKVAEHLAEFAGQAKALSAALTDPAQRTLLDNAVAKSAEFKTAFEEAAKLTVSSDKILQDSQIGRASCRERV